MGFSDQQVITGISIIVGGVSQLQWGISIYHWQSVVNFAWLSTITHIMTLSVLRNEIRANKTIRFVRFVAIGILIMTLISVSYPIGYTSSPDMYPDRSLASGFPAWCLYENLLYPNSSGAKPEYNWLYFVVAATFLGFSYVTRVSLLYSNTGFIHGVLHIPKNQPSTYIESKLSILKERQNERRKVRYYIIFRVLESLYMLVVCGSSLYRSQVFEVLWFFFAIAWGIIRVIVSRADSMYEDYIPSAVSDQHSIWGFGQAVAIGLLAIPIASFFGKSIVPVFHTVIYR
ncbi:ADP-ribosylation factor GTPase activating protein, ER-Golgi transport [Cadophora gregata]|uniref:ADP-ribosylation factor GTPase activating protein, ER-Golgi transport n=1 Tax=Cadophora gregata TaxID=51156 RepID=UPI0026DBF1A6|nr:ADP-ribosylation factor GTPase activating protein, ER-Golgi transport [Cadophora gregata]KAK0113060.1 ADP-ribosylation factor GTPase activating protein, ER-Golgi transport [Cadophora gregata]